MHQPRWGVVRKLPDSMRNPAPSRGATVISAGRGLVGAHGALLERLFAVTLEHQIGGAPDVDFRDHATKTARLRSTNVQRSVYEDTVQWWLFHGTNDRGGCRPAHCRRVHLCRRARRCRHPAQTSRGNRAAIWGAISPAAAAQTDTPITEAGAAVARRRVMAAETRADIVRPKRPLSRTGAVSRCQISGSIKTGPA
jgi:hypothetical protein